MKKPRGLRPSFVVTAALIGCGGQVADGSNVPENYGSNPPAHVADTGVDGDTPAVCPPTEPTLGTSCEGALACDYTRCTSSGMTGHAYQCSGGVWTNGFPSSCNPPPVCPSEEPTPGSACATSGFGTCSYADTCSEQPPGSGRDVLACSAGKWKLVADYSLKCPASLPTEGSSCRCGAHTSYAEPCSYCMFGKGASCDPTTGTWTVTNVTCNPPAPEPDGGFEVGVRDAATD